MSESNPTWRVAVLAGGDSDERAISLLSGAAVHQALTERGHLALHLDPAVVDLAGVDWRQFDVAFLALHGQFGEDGQVQQILENAGIPYTGSDATASRLAFSKSAAKERFLQNGVPTPEYSLLHYTDDVSRVERITREIGYPLVIKPDCQGSSLGITIVQSAAMVPAALRHCFEFDSFAVIERAIPGTEWTVGLLDELVLHPILIETDREFFDWTAKYEDDNTRYLMDTAFPTHVVTAIADAGRNACQALGTRGMVRVDLRVDDAMQPWVLEVNTIPGCTSHSLIPKAAARMGIEFGELCERAIRSCLGRVPPVPHILPRLSVRRSVSDH
ncbi:MAG: D-alanine--D-alanine ligase [Planctomycetes bacterium]|nr:D-alanine--D-alanine ligase [Planctomycetota bacterium]